MTSPLSFNGKWNDLCATVGNKDGEPSLYYISAATDNQFIYFCAGRKW